MKKLRLVVLITAFSILIGCTPRPEDYDSQTYITPELPSEIIQDATPTPSPEHKQEAEPQPSPDIAQEIVPTPLQRFGFIDAHADTISQALTLQQDERGMYSNNALHIDFARLSEFEAPVQVFALWLAEEFVADAFERTNYMLDFFELEVEKNSNLIEIALNLDDIKRIAGEGKISAVLAIEGGEALMGKLEHLDYFYNRGVRILGLTWNNENELGFGQASGTAEGLKPFGFEVIRRMDELGMILDVSHLNEAGFWDAHSTSTRPYMASHSNSYAVMPHNRNLLDDQIMAIVDSGGIIGFNMFPPFIATGGGATLDDAMAHFRHFIHIGAGAHIGLGSDFDGVPSLIQGVDGVSSLKMFEKLLAEEFGEGTAFQIMEGNFYEFFVRYFDE